MKIFITDLRAASDIGLTSKPFLIKIMVEKFFLSVMITGFSWFAIECFGYCKIAFELRRGKIPYKLSEFLNHKISPSEYNRVVSKVSTFLDTVTTKSKAEIILTQDDINTFFKSLISFLGYL